MTIQQANQYFAALPDGFADPAQLGALLPASVQQVQFVGVAGTAGKTAVARLLAAILHAQGIRAVSTMPGASRLLPASVWMASRWTKHCCARRRCPCCP
ncbi:hypothetical protein [Faecalibacterium prausnitzii]|uniref:hypothetical protein n=1 Tax=Faecalibacterium prausnitzii TaxID=853 RepID=UPI001CBD3889|nr:hypothetical protein [Faecalibacterium prausnitzii]